MIWCEEGSGSFVSAKHLPNAHYMQAYLPLDTWTWVATLCELGVVGLLDLPEPLERYADEDDDEAADDELRHVIGMPRAKYDTEVPRVRPS